MSILIKNIRGLVQTENEGLFRKAGKEMSILPILENSYLLLENDLIKDYGVMDQLPGYSANLVLDASSRYVFPSFVDSHTHIVYAGSREKEFEEKIQGLSYQEIAIRGGGILNSARKLQLISEEDLYKQALERVWEVIRMGTGALEIKSGYGLSVESELKMLRVIRRLKETVPIEIKATFLGAHAVPSDMDKVDYIDLVINQMIPRVAAERLADYVDVFCEEGFFSPEESTKILRRGIDFGLKAKVHANQLSYSGGVQVGVEVDAISVDHLETMGDEEIKCLAESNTIGTLLPGAAFFLGMHYPPARRMLAAGIPLALASDYNPGSAPSGNMPFLLSLACLMMKMTPEEAINAATINGACALEMQATHGSITRGKKANLFVTKEMPSIAFLPYSFGSQLIDKIILNGELIEAT